MPKKKFVAKRLKAGRGYVGKQEAVPEFLERKEEVKAYPVASTKRNILHSSMKSNIKTGSKIYTDDLPSYKSIVGYNHLDSMEKKLLIGI